MGQKIVIIGGSVAGLTGATRARRISEEDEIIIVEKSRYLCYNVPALSMYASGLIQKKETILDNIDTKLTSIYNLTIKNSHEAVEIRTKDKVIVVKDLNTRVLSELSYDKLLLASGFTFNKHKVFKGTYNNFFTLKTFEDADRIREHCEKTASKKVSIIGANAFALIAASHFNQSGFDVSVITEKKRLELDLDEELLDRVTDHLQKSGIKLFFKSEVEKISCDEFGTIHKVATFRDVIDTQVILYMDNMKPEKKLALKAGIREGDKAGIEIDEHLQTSEEGVFAAGSLCNISHVGGFKGQPVYSFGISQKMGRIAGSVMAGVEEKLEKTIDARYLEVCGLHIGSAGYSQYMAEQAGFSVYTFNMFTGNKERFISSNKQMYIKIITCSESRKVLGVEVLSEGESVDKVVDTISTAIYSDLTIDDLIKLNLSYFPTISPHRNHVNSLGMICEDKLDGISESKSVSEIFADPDKFILDIRSEKEYKKGHLENSVCIPLDQLRKRIDELPGDKNIYIYGHVGLRSYVAQRILKGKGFERIFNIDGGINTLKVKENHLKKD